MHLFPLREACNGTLLLDTICPGDTPAHQPTQGANMRPLSRHPVNKNKSARKFRKQAARTKGVNIPGVMRGGIRL